MLRNLSKIASTNVPTIVEKVGTILGRSISPGSYQIAVEGNTYSQVWSVSLIDYSIGSQVKVIFDRGLPQIVP